MTSCCCWDVLTRHHLKSQALDEGADLKVGWYPEREDEPQPRRSYKSQTSVDSVESLEPRNLQPSSEGSQHLHNT